MPEPQPYASAPSRFQMRPSRVLRRVREGKVAFKTQRNGRIFISVLPPKVEAAE